MIYLDNAATTLQKPPCVGQAMLDALEHAGNPGRGAHEPTLHAARIVYHARETLATLLHAEGPDCIAFTANVTQALNTALCGLVRPGDHVITTVCEHNSVLRPLYRLREQGAEVSFVEVDDTGRLRYEQFEKFLRPNTRLVVVTHASNVTGDLTDLAFVSAFAKKHGLTLVVDAAQTAGARPIDVQALGVDVLCFTGHKALLGPQGTGGLYVRPGLTMAPLVVGGSGIHSFDETHPSQMPTALEAGTLNVPGLAGLGAGVEWILSQGVEALHEKEMALTRLFYEKIVHAPDVKIYGSFDETDRAPIVSPPVPPTSSGRTTASVSGRALIVRPSSTKPSAPWSRGWCGSASPTRTQRPRCSEPPRRSVSWPRRADMRRKRQYIVLSFASTARAMGWEKECAARGIPGRLIPLPSEITAGCGLGWRMLPEDWQAWQSQLNDAGYDAATPVEQ